MDFSSLKKWAKEQRSGHIKDVFLPYAILILSMIIVSQVSDGFKDKYLISLIISLAGYFLIFVLNLGVTEYMCDFINERELKIEKTWSKFNNITDSLLVFFLQSLFIFLFSLLLIVPGIIKALSYALVPFIMIDEDNNLKGMDVLRKSEELMIGHKMELFQLLLSFIGWHIIGIMTCGIFEIFVIPYQQIAVVKYLSDLKDKANGITPKSIQESVPVQPNNTIKFCTSCGTQVSSDTAFCPNCGSKID